METIERSPALGAARHTGAPPATLTDISLLQALGVPAYMTDEEGRITAYNEAAAEMWGRRPVVGKDSWCGSHRVFWSDGTPMQLEDSPIAVTLRDDKPVRGVEAILERPDGSRAWFMPYPTPIHDDDGRVTGIINVLIDITELKLTEEVQRRARSRDSFLAAARAALTESLDDGELLERLVRLAVPAIADWASIHARGDDGGIVRLAAAYGPPVFKERYERPLDIPPDAPVGPPAVLRTGQPELHRLLPPATPDELEAGSAPARALGVRSAICVPLRTRSGVIAALSLGSLTAGRYTDDDLALAIELADHASVALENARLYAEAQKIARELTVKAAELQTVLDIVPVGIGIAGDPECTSIEANREFARMLGISSSDNASLTAPDGERPPFKIFENSIEVAPHDLPMQRAARLKQTTERRQLDIVFDDGRVMHEYGSAAPLFDEAGNVRGSVGAFVDVTELRRTQDELWRALAAKDEFLGMVSHELKTPITVILGNAKVLTSRVGDAISAEAREQALRDIATESDRLHGIIDNLLILARAESGQKPEIEPLRVEDAVANVVAGYRNGDIPHEIVVRMPRERRFVLGEPVYVHQVLENLISNCMKYAPVEEPIEIEAAYTDHDVRVEVLDRGRGISEDEASRLFEPFYRGEHANHAASGVGIGLAVCKRLIESLGGRVWARPRDGGGAAFGFALPLYVPEGDDVL